MAVCLASALENAGALPPHGETVSSEDGNASHDQIDLAVRVVTDCLWDEREKLRWLLAEGAQMVALHYGARGVRVMARMNAAGGLAAVVPSTCTESLCTSSSSTRATGIGLVFPSPSTAPPSGADALGPLAYFVHPAFAAKVSTTVGAGDSFDGAFLHSLVASRVLGRGAHPLPRLQWERAVMDAIQACATVPFASLIVGNGFAHQVGSAMAKLVVESSSATPKSLGELRDLTPFFQGDALPWFRE